MQTIAMQLKKSLYKIIPSSFIITFCISTIAAQNIHSDNGDGTSKLVATFPD